MRKITDSVESGMRKKRKEITLSAREVRCLYFMKESYVEELVESAAMLDETDRKLALKLVNAMLEHRRSLLS